MMRKILNILLLTAFALTSCDLTEDRVFDEDPDARLRENINYYYEVLTTSPNSWFLVVDTKVKGGFQLWMNFNDRNRVSMYCDLDATWDNGTATSKVANESSYTIRGDQTPTLYFETYNYIHMLADPQGTSSNGNVNGGENGAGYESDFEFEMVEYDNGRFRLKGKFNGCDAIMYPATAAQAVAVSEGALSEVYDDLRNFLVDNQWLCAEINGHKVHVQVYGRRITLASYVDGTIRETTVGSYLDMGSFIDPTQDVSSVYPLEPFDYMGWTIDGVVWDGGYWKLATDHGELKLETSDEPVYPMTFGPNGMFKKMRFVHAEHQPIMSQKYWDEMYGPAYNAMIASSSFSPRYILYLDLEFTTDNDGLPAVQCIMRSLSSSEYSSYWFLYYTIDEENNILTFTDREINFRNSNAANYGRYMRQALDIFSTVEYTTYSYSSSSNYTIEKGTVVPHSFTMGWLNNTDPETILDGMVGAIYWVDDPDMYFCGSLSN